MADTTACPGCGTKFSTFKWKHQCHRCTAARCHDCSSHKMPIPKLGITKPERVCDPCFIALNLALKNTADLEQFPVKTLKQFALVYNIPAALNNALEKNDIIAGLLKYYDPNQDKTHERAKNREKKHKKKHQQKPPAAEYPGNVNTTNHNHSNNTSTHNNRTQSVPHQERSDNFFDNFSGFFSGGSHQTQNRAHNNSNTSNGNNSGGFDGFFDNLFGSFFTDNSAAHPFNPPQQNQSANANTNVHYNNGAYTNNRGSNGSAAPSNNSQQQNSSYPQPNVNNTNYSNNNGSNGQSQQQYSSQPQQAPPRTNPQPQAPVGEVVIPENFELNELSVAQLKEILKRHRVDFKDCFEKSDLVQKIQEKIMNKKSDADKKPTSSNNTNANSDATYVPYNEKVGSEDKDVCVICQDRHIKCVFLECGHLACCMECSVKVQHCPLCRKYISRVVEIYHAYK